MKLLAVLLVVTLVWLVLASVRDGRGRGALIDPSDAWMLEQHERVVRLGQEAMIPAGHPLWRLELGDRRRQASGGVMKSLIVAAITVGFVAGSVAPLAAADDAKVKSATRRVERGGKMIGDGKVSSGIGETAKGVGDTVVEGAKYSGNKLKASGRAAQPAAKSAWASFKESASSFGVSVKRFFTRLFS